MKRFAKSIACLLFSLLLCSWVSAQQPSLAGFQRQVQRRVARDQAVRIGLQKIPRTKTGEFDQKEHNRLMQRASDVDDENLAWLRKQISKIGVPDPKVMGKKCAEGFYLLILHADRDREFQKECILLMKDAPDQWPEFYVKLLEIRASFPQPMKIKLSDPNETKTDPNETKTVSGENQALPSDGQLNHILDFPQQQVDPPKSAQQDETR